MTFRSHTPAFTDRDPNAAIAAAGVTKGKLCILDIQSDYVRSVARILEHAQFQPARAPWPVTLADDPYYASTIIINGRNYSSTSPSSAATHGTTTLTPPFSSLGPSPAFITPQETAVYTNFANLFGLVFRPGAKQFLSQASIGATPGYSLIMNDSAGGLTFPGDFTFEFWINAATQGKIILSKASGLRLNMQTGMFENYGGPDLSFGTIKPTEWTHVAIVRSSSTLTSFVNGAIVATASYAGTIDFEGSSLGLGTSNTTYFDGTLDEIRITKGVARYSGAFSLKTGLRYELPNSFQSFPSQGASSVVYDPATDMLFAKVDYHTWSNDNATNFVIRTKLLKIDPRQQIIVASRTLWSAGEDDSCYQANPYSAQKLNLVDGELVCRALDSSGYTNIHYEAFDTNLNPIYRYKAPHFGLPPSLQGNNTSISDRSNGPYNKAGSSYYVYSAPFTGGPYSAYPTVYSIDPYYNNVTFLLNHLDNSTRFKLKDQRGHDLIATGYPVTSTDSLSTGLGTFTEFYLSDKLTCPLSSDFALPGDFTIEFTVNFGGVGGLSASATTILGTQIPFAMPEANISVSFTNDGTSYPSAVMTAVVLGTTLTYTDTTNASTMPNSDGILRSLSDHHVAITRTGSAIAMFLDGVLVASGTNSSTGPATSIELGNAFNGKLYEVRITSGICRYTADFTPPWLAKNAGAYSKTNLYKRTVTTYVADGTCTPANTFGLYTKTVTSGYAKFDITQTSPTIPFSLNTNTIIYNEVTNEVWGFASDDLNTIGEAAANIGVRWNISANTLTLITKQGIMTKPSVTAGSITKHDFDLNNGVQSFGTISNYGLAITNSHVRSGFTGSLELPKSSTYARLPAYTGIGSGSPTLGSSAWSLELFYYNPVLQTEATPDVLLSEASASPGFEVTATRSATNCVISFRVHNGTTTVTVPSLSTSAEDIGVSSWAHIALIRSSNLVLGFVNGTLTHQLTLGSSGTSIAGSFAKAFIGCSSTKTNFARGHIQQLRFTRTALWTASFTAPTTLTAVAISGSGYPSSIYKPTVLSTGDVIAPIMIGASHGAQQFNQTGVLLGEYGFTNAIDSAEVNVNIYSNSKFNVVEPLGKLLSITFGSGGVGRYVEQFTIGTYSKTPTRVKHVYGFLASDPFTELSSGSPAIYSIDKSSVFGIPSNGRAVTTNFKTIQPTATELNINDVGYLSTDFAAPIVSGAITYSYGTFPSGSYTGYDNVQWYKFFHDGIKTHMVTLVQPSNAADVAAQSNMIDRLLALGLYNDTGKLLYKTNNATNYATSAGVDTMLPISGFNYDINYVSATVPYAFPLTVLKSYPIGYYYVAVASRLSTSVPGVGDQQTINEHLTFSDVEFDVKQTPISVGGAYYTYQEKARLSFETAEPFVETYGRTVTPIDSSVDGTDLSQETVTPIAGTGSLALRLSKIGTAPLQTVSFSFTNALTPVDASWTSTLGKFDSHLGTLSSIALTLTGASSGAIQITLSGSSPASQTVRGRGNASYFVFSSVPALSTILDNSGSELFISVIDTTSTVVTPGSVNTFNLTGTASASPDLSTVFAALSQAGGGTFTISGTTITGFSLSQTGGSFATITNSSMSVGFSGTITYTYS
jgi:hypothetical protein